MKYNLWNMLTSIVNAQKSGKSIIQVPNQKLLISFLNVLWDEGYILGYKRSVVNKTKYSVFLKYKNKQPAIKKVEFISKPSNRKYFSLMQLWKIDLSIGTAILSTSKGILSLNSCKKYGVGGELFVVIK